MSFLVDVLLKSNLVFSMSSLFSTTISSSSSILKAYTKHSDGGHCAYLFQAEKRLRTELRRKMELERVSSLKPLLKEIGDGHLPFMSLHYTNGDGVQHLVAAVYLGKVDTLNTEKLKSMVSISCDSVFLV